LGRRTSDGRIPSLSHGLGLFIKGFVSSSHLRRSSGKIAMQSPAALECPHCGKSRLVNKAIPPGAKVTCPRCGGVFHYRPPANGGRGGDTDNGSEAEPENALWHELFEPDDTSKAGGPNGGTEPRYRSVTNELVSSLPPPPQSAPGLATRAGASSRPLSQDLLAPPSTRSKDVLIGGKPVRFLGARHFLGAVLIVAVGMLAYFIFAWWIGEMHSISKLSEKVADTKKKKILEPDLGTGKAKNRKAAVVEADALATADPTPAPAAASAPSAGILERLRRIVAPNPARIAQVEVSVKDAVLRTIDPKSQVRYLVLGLQVTNRAELGTTNLSWPPPALNAKLRDQFHLYKWEAPSAPDVKLIKPGDSLEYYLVFEKTAPSAELSLELTTSERDPPFQFSIPAALVRSQ
jgi:hypothetical protein